MSEVKLFHSFTPLKRFKGVGLVGLEFSNFKRGGLVKKSSAEF